MGTCSGQTDGQTAVNAHSSPPGDFVTLLAKRGCFHGDPKLLSRMDAPLLTGSERLGVQLEQNPSMVKQGTWGIMKEV